MKRFVLLAFLVSIVIPAKAEIVGPKVSRVASEDNMKASIAKVELVEEGGNQTALRDLMSNGKPSLITVWAHWCANCRAEMADYKVIAATCPERWNVIFVSSRRFDFKKDLAKYRSYGLPWKIYRVIEAQSADVDVGRAFFGATNSGEVVTPLHYLVSASGKVDAIVNARMNLAEPKKLSAFCG
jgi:thiol-disulfide isomerase/thioredoxin